MTGRVVKLAVQAGEAVPAGALIAEVDTQDLVAGQQQALAAVRVAEAGLRQAQAGLGQVQGQQGAVAAALEEAQLHRDRMASLHRQGAVSQAMLDQAETRLRVLQAEQRQLHAAHEQAIHSIEQAQAQLRQAQAGVSQIQAQLSYGRILAPFAGVITQTLVEVGSLLGPGQPVAVLESTQRLRLEVQVPESVLPFLRLGQTLPVHLDLYPQPLMGEVSQIIPSASPNSRTSTVKLRLPPIPNAIPGWIGRIQVQTPQPQTALVIPSKSVVERFGITGVYRLDNGDPQFTPVVLGSRIGDQVQVHGGIEAGDVLAVF
ncbi:MAG: efflux RND transporter periplasmic adaptor subunit [Thermostichales cyanobacterium BF4_bins_65]